MLYHFFSNKLSPEQEQEFNELLATDSEFKAQYDFEQDLKQVIRNKETVDLKGKLAGFEKEISKDTPVRTLPNTNYRKWAMVASIALLVGLGWFGYNNFAGPNYGNLYDENFQQYPNTVYAITRGDGGDNSMERKAYVAYETDDNVLAIELFEQLKTTNSSENVTFFLAQSYLKNEQPKEAIVFFEEVISSNGEFAPQSLWYSALAYLKMNQKENVVQALKRLVTDGRYKKTEAAAILKEVE